MSKRQSRPPLTIETILAWADAYRARTGKWPSAKSGQVTEAPDDTWGAINSASAYGYRGLPGGAPLSALLKTHRGSSAHQAKSLLTVHHIIALAEAHCRRTGRWPSDHSGPVLEAPAENWHAINAALLAGHRGLPGGDTLGKLRQRRGVA